MLDANVKVLAQKMIDKKPRFVEICIPRNQKIYFLVFIGYVTH